MRLATLLIAGALALTAQTVTQTTLVPECTRDFTLTAVGSDTAIDNRKLACNYWRLVYANDGFTALTLVVQSGELSGTFNTWQGAVKFGINPNTSTVAGETEFRGYFPYARVSLVAATGTGTVQGKLMGWRTQPTTQGFIACDDSKKLDMSSATTTEIIPASGTLPIYICQMSVVSGGATTATLKYGTGTNCGTGTTSLSPAWDWTAQTGISEGSGVGVIYKVPAGNALCATNSGSVNLHVHAAYTYGIAQ